METNGARPSLRAVCDVMSVVTWLLSASADGCCWILGGGGGGGGAGCAQRGESPCGCFFRLMFPQEPELKIVL